MELLSVHCGDFLGSTTFPSFHSSLQTLTVKTMLRLNFSDYRRWIPKETFYNIVASGQQLEQLYVPGTKEPHILAYHYLKSKFCLTRLVPNFADSTMYTLFERRIWSGTEFTFMWPSLRVEELCPPVDPQLCPLRKEDFCPLMLWVTLPRDVVKVMTDCTLQSKWNFGMITEQVSYMGDHFNFSFPLVPHFYFTPSTFRSHRCKELLEWRIATLMHPSLLDFDHLARLGIEWKNTLE